MKRMLLVIVLAILIIENVYCQNEEKVIPAVDIKAEFEKTLKKVSDEHSRYFELRFEDRGYNTDVKYPEIMEILPASHRIYLTRSLADENPFVRAAAAVVISKLATHSTFYSGNEFAASGILGDLGKLLKDLHPVVRLQAFNAYGMWLGDPNTNVETFSNAIPGIVDLIDSNNKFLSNLALSDLWKIDTWFKFLGYEIIGETLIDALSEKLTKINNSKLRDTALALLAEFSVNYKNKKAVKLMIKIIDEHDAEFHWVHDAIKDLGDSSAIPLLQRRLLKAGPEEEKSIKSVLTKFGVDIYSYDDFSTGLPILLNFWKALSLGDVNTAKKCLSRKKLDDETIKRVISDHEEMLKLISIDKVDFTFSSDCDDEDIGHNFSASYSSPSYTCKAGEHVRSNCLLRIGIERYGGSYDYHFELEEGGVWKIIDISPNLSYGIKATLARRDYFKNIRKPIRQFLEDTGNYPSTEEGLDALLVKPATVSNWKGPYLDEKPVDPWGREYKYRCKEPYPARYEVYSLGEDGVESKDDFNVN